MKRRREIQSAGVRSEKLEKHDHSEIVSIKYEQGDCGVNIYIS